MGHQSDLLDDLLRAVGARDIAAFRRLYDLTLPRLSQIARLITRDATLAEDVLQIAYFKIWEKAGQNDPGRGSAMGWMLRICRNTAIDELRKQRLAQSREINEFDECLAEARVVQDSDVMDVVRGLPHDQADALLSVYGLGLTHVELAHKLNIPLGTVKSRVRRALITAREMAR